MENLIQFFDFKSSSLRGSRLIDNHLSVWYNSISKQKTYGVTFASNIKTDKSFIKIGKLGSDVCFMFTNESGIRIYGEPSKRKNIVFNSKGFIEHIFSELKPSGKERKVFKLKVINDDIFVIQEEIK